jgi:hypothetical protein
MKDLKNTTFAQGAPLLLGLATLVALAGCSPSSTPGTPGQNAVIECIVAASDVAGREVLGAQVNLEETDQPVRLRRFDQLACRGWQGIFASKRDLTTQGVALTERLMPEDAFRRGMQTAVWRRAGHPPAAAQTLAGLVVQTGANVVLRAWGESCRLVSAQQTSLLRDMEAPYLAAFVGTRGLAASIHDARGLAASLQEQAKAHALYAADRAAAPCDSATQGAQLDAHMQSMRDFGSGTNALVPGCKVEPTGDELALRCS